MYAVFETGGKQYKAQKGDVVHVERLDIEAGKTVSFDVLMVSDENDVMIGTPIVKGAKVRAKVIEHGKERKIIVFKYKPKIHERIKQGHRQPFTKIEITGITTGKAGEKPVEEETTVKLEEKKPAAEKQPAKTADAKPVAEETVKAAPKAAAKTTAAKETEKKPAAKTASKTAAAADEKKPVAKKPAVKKEAESKE